MRRFLGTPVLIALASGALLVAACGDDSYHPQAENTAALCADGVDNDEDGNTDCADTDCQGLSVCTETACDDGVDNEGDGLIDCLDPDCQSTAACTEDTSTRCQDFIDNDGDGFTDCDDDGCKDFVFCEPHETQCQNGVDDDGDGDIDCLDSDCSPLAVCGGFCYPIHFDRPGTFGMAITEANDDTDPSTDCVQYDVIVSATSPQASTQICLYLDQGTTPVVPCQDANVTNPVTFTGVSLCQGNHSLFAKVEQGASVCTAQVQRMDVIVYETPSCTITAPAGISMDSGNPTLTNQSDMDFEVTTTGATVELFVNGSATPPATVSGGVAAFPAANLGADGPVQVRARCHNPGTGTGQADSVLYYLDKDTEAPNLQITSPTVGQQLGDADCPVTVTVTGVEAGQQVCAQVQGGSPGASGCSSASTGPTDSIDLTVDCVSGDPVTLEAVTQDDHGNSATATVDVTIDSSAPSVLIQTPTANTVYNKADDTLDAGTDALEMSIVACTDDNYSPSNITLTVDGVSISSITPTVQAASCAGLTHQITWSAPFAFSQAVSGLQTPHTVLVTVSDGINSGQNQVSFSVDTVAPAISFDCSICEPSAAFYTINDDVCTGAPMQVEGTLKVDMLEVGEPVSLAVTNGGGPVGASPYSVSSTSAVFFYAQYNPGSGCGIALQSGQNDLVATATDQAGNVGVAQKSVTYGPGLISSPSAGAILSTGDDCDAGAAYGIPVEVQVDPTVTDPVQVEGTSQAGSWTYTSATWNPSCSVAPCTHSFCISVPAGEVEQSDIALSLSIGGNQLPGGPTGIIVDISPPPAVTVEAPVVIDRRAAQVELAWSSVEDPESGLLTAWEIRCVEDDTISGANWATAMTFSGEPTPAAASTRQTALVPSDGADPKLRPGHSYSCAIRGQNAAGLWSDLTVFDTVSDTDLGLVEYPLTIEGYSLYDREWWLWPSVNPAGDLNGDGYDDLAVGYALTNPPANPATKAAAVYFGSASGPSATHRIQLTCGDGSFGSMVTGIGDFDGAVFDAATDSATYPDLAVGASAEDRVYIWRGRNGMDSGNLDCANADITVVGPAGSRFGDTISAIGDFDGDGLRDIAIGAPFYNSYNGTVFILFGRDFGSYPVTVNLSSGANAWGAVQLDGLSGVVGLGQAGADLDQDGRADLLFTDGYGGSANHGALHLLRGYAVSKSQNTLTVLTPSDLDQSVDLTAPVANASFFGSQSVVPMDYDGDGCLDVAVGAAGANIQGSASNVGDVVVYRGVRTSGVCVGSLETSWWASLEGGAQWDLLGLPVAGVFDMVGSTVMPWRFDGIVGASSDLSVIAGAVQHDRAGGGSTGPGYVALWYAGVAGGRSLSSADLVWSDAASGGEFHWVNMVGDLDGDGYVDLAIADTGYGTAGRIRLYR